jgi:hypothetical protein
MAIMNINKRVIRASLRASRPLLGRLHGR